MEHKKKQKYQAEADKIRNLLGQKSYEQALAELEKADTKQSDPVMHILLVRTLLATGNTAKAVRAAGELLGHKFNPDFAIRAEAELLQGNYSAAYKNFASALIYNPKNIETQFLAALAAYKNGFIQKAMDHLEQALRLEFDWEEESALDFVAQHILSRNGFMDFEHIYLDIQEHLFEENENPQNRWLNLNMPVYDYFAAMNYDQQKQRAFKLADILNIEHPDIFFAKGEEQLKTILQDFAGSEVDARFGLEGLQHFENKRYSEIARLMLALELEHVKEFAELFGLTKDQVTESHLQGIIRLLPLSIATALLLLYAASDPKDQLEKMTRQNMDSNIISGLIALCFSSYYKEVDRFRASTLTSSHAQNDKRKKSGGE